LFAGAWPAIPGLTLGGDWTFGRAAASRVHKVYEELISASVIAA
jgi:hypothetical protein